MPYYTTVEEAYAHAAERRATIHAKLGVSDPPPLLVVRVE